MNWDFMFELIIDGRLGFLLCQFDIVATVPHSSQRHIIYLTLMSDIIERLPKLLDDEHETQAL